MHAGVVTGAPSEPLSSARSDPEYLLPRTSEEYERLGRQAAFLGGPTERLFRAAGIRPGMRILDVGSGAGDVALLAAELVGPDGMVVGVDVDGGALRTARARSEALGLANVSFVEGDGRTAALGDDFDAAVGRLVLMYSGDPLATLRDVARHVRPDGLIAFQEFDFYPAPRSFSIPDDTLWNTVGGLLIDAFLRAGMQARMGPRLFGLFAEAGVAAATLHHESVGGGGPDFGGYAWLAGVARSLAPVLATFGMADAEQLGLDTLADRLREDTVRTGAVVWTPPLVGAYGRRT